ncbi:pilus assembly protein TadB [Siccirubricoccus deserti]|uniref:Type II secretion system F family protein n=1 Tax=Siccirubricoccus deserti TaxID=2013562 RepID=A0A9X0UEC6_9PROT|nr:type II secretion system F family protein [Siccirubricoccus deserti]MBC4016661.1 type II secretion system F family protein [Siccirubricoccus deserti]GGC50896.1 pilus assembly protein TadB [Siccirubricoccus deserti]
MRTGLLLIAALVLMLGMALGAIALVRGGSGRLLRERVRGISAAPAAASATVLPSIRVENSTHGALSLRLFRFLRFNPDIPQEQIIAWPLVALFGLVVAGVAAMTGSNLLGRIPALLAAPAAGLLACRAVFSWQHARYCHAVFEQIPDALGLIIRSIRAGLPLAEALRAVSRDIASPTREEFARVVGDMVIGRPIEVALFRLHDRTGLTEYAFLAVTLGLQAQTGGSLAETLENLVDTVRKRVAMVKRASALAGEAKAQAGLLAVLPFVAAVLMAASQPFYIRTFTENPAGQRMALVGLGLMLMGLLTIRWLIRRASRD